MYRSTSAEGKRTELKSLHKHRQWKSADDLTQPAINKNEQVWGNLEV